MKNTRSKINSRKTISVLIILQIFNFINPESNYSQVNEEWVKLYIGALNTADISTSMVLDKDGNLIIAGQSGGAANGFLTIKYNPLGDTLWVRIFNQILTNDADKANAVTTDDSGNVYVTGSTYNTTTQNDYTTIKYNSSGVQQWVKIYSDASNQDDIATAIVVDDSGNSYVTGYSDASGTNDDYATIKYNPSGDELWVRRFNNPNSGTTTDKAIGIALDIDGNIIVAGQSGSNSDFVTIKYTPAGDEIWVNQTSGNPFDDTPEAMAVDDEGNIFITGSTQFSSSSGSKDWLTVKLDSSGNTQWYRIYGQPQFNTNDDKASAITLDNEGNIYVAGRDYATSISTDFVIIKYNQDGDSLWVKRYDNNNSNDRSLSIALDENKNVYLAGVSGSKITALKYSEIGEFIWSKHSNVGSAINSKVSIAIDPSGNIYLSGSDGGSIATNIVTMKYSQKHSLSLSALLQGRYDSSTDSMKSDTVTVQLRNYISPYNIVDTASDILDSRGRRRFYFNNSVIQSQYFIVVKHRNSIETWSSAAVSLTSNEMNYDFTTAASQAFGNNLFRFNIEPVDKYALYSGDVNQNGSIDLEDMLDVYNDGVSFATGYVVTDVNGDNTTDLSDLLINYNNSVGFVSVKKPGIVNRQS